MSGRIERLIANLGLALTFAISPLAGAAQAAASSVSGEDYTFGFQDADIVQVVQEVLGQAGIAYAIDPAVTGKLSFRIEQHLTREQLLAALEAVLSANGVAMVHRGDQLLIAPQGKAKAMAGIRRGVEGAGGAGYEIVAVPLAYAQPTEVARAMEAIAAENTVLYSNDKLGLLLLGGSGQQLKSALETLKVFDQNAFQDSKLRWYALTQAQATTVATELERIVQGAGLVGVAVVPLKRLNGIIVFGRSGEALDEIAKWVTKLDTPGKEAGSSLWVYRPRFASAEALARTLSSVLGTQGRSDAYSAPALVSVAPVSVSVPAAPVGASVIGPLGSGDDEVRVGVDKDSNTLLFFAAPARWIQVQRILNEIDRPARQILIEASILEVTLGHDFQFGVDWSALSNDLAVSSINNSAGVVRASHPGLAITFLSGDIEAAVKALGSRTAIEVVSAPKIVALDNHTARLQIGDQVPVVVQASQSTAAGNGPLVSTVDYRSTGVILTVTPRVTGDNQVVLEVSQEVSLSAKTSTSGIDSPTIQQRRFESTLILQSGSVVALGGLISTNRTNTRSGVPGLKDLPGVGSLFRSDGKSQGRSELIVLLSAKIIRDQDGSDRVMSDLMADMRELKNRGLLAKPK